MSQDVLNEAIRKMSEAYQEAGHVRGILEAVLVQIEKDKPDLVKLARKALAEGKGS
jgi:hypothetical protein